MYFCLKFEKINSSLEGKNKKKTKKMNSYNKFEWVTFFLLDVLEMKSLLKYSSSLSIYNCFNFFPFLLFFILLFCFSFLAFSCLQFCIGIFICICINNTFDFNDSKYGRMCSICIFIFIHVIYGDGDRIRLWVANQRCKQLQTKLKYS